MSHNWNFDLPTDFNPLGYDFWKTAQRFSIFLIATWAVSIFEFVYPIVSPMKIEIPKLNTVRHPALYFLHWQMQFLTDTFLKYSDGNKRTNVYLLQTTFIKIFELCKNKGGWKISRIEKSKIRIKTLFIKQQLHYPYINYSLLATIPCKDSAISWKLTELWIFKINTF